MKFFTLVLFAVVVVFNVIVPHVCAQRQGARGQTQGREKTPSRGIETQTQSPNQGQTPADGPHPQGAEESDEEHKAHEEREGGNVEPEGKTGDQDVNQDGKSEDKEEGQKETSSGGDESKTDGPEVPKTSGGDEGHEGNAVSGTRASPRRGSGARAGRT